MVTNNNFIIMSINIVNNGMGGIVGDARCDDVVKGQEERDEKIDVPEEPDIVSSTLTGNPDSTAFLLEMDEDSEKESQDLGSSGSWDSDDVSYSKPLPVHLQEETFRSILGQVIIPFFLAGCGTVGAGLILDIVAFSEVFQEVPQIIILIPALLGLKGNIEMTLASRLSTEANMGRLNTTRSKFRHILGNIYLVQFQGITIGFFASLSPYWMGTPPANLQNALLLSASSVATTSIASFFLGVLMSTIVVMSKKYDINPDNVAAPLAASIGDIVTLTLLFIISTLIYDRKDELPWLSPAILGFYFVSLPFWFYLTYKQSFSRKVLMAPSTWLPIFGGMVISCFAGKIFDHSIKMFKKIAVLQPVINGVGGNIAAVQASRISTYLHCSTQSTRLPVCNRLESFGGSDGSIASRNLCNSFFQGIHAKSALALLLLLVPGHVIFVAVIWFIHPDLNVSLIFMTIYILAAVIQVLILLYLVDILVPYFWRSGIDPDNAAIPCLTATGDFLGTALLVLAFQLIYMLQGGDSDEGIVAYLKTI